MPPTSTILPIRYPAMPFGVALARNRVPSSRSTTSSPAVVARPMKAIAMPSAPGSTAAPRLSPMPGSVASRMKNSVISRPTAGNR
jgi:hypothetical protein